MYFKISTEVILIYTLRQRQGFMGLKLYNMGGESLQEKRIQNQEANGMQGDLDQSSSFIPAMVLLYYYIFITKNKIKIIVITNNKNNGQHYYLLNILSLSLSLTA